LRALINEVPAEMGKHEDGRHGNSFKHVLNVSGIAQYQCLL
jgi:hypothetical protein